jgi:hypothetical protein
MEPRLPPDLLKLLSAHGMDVSKPVELVSTPAVPLPRRALLNVEVTTTPKLVLSHAQIT